MKKLALSLAALVAFAMVSCGGNKANEGENAQAVEEVAVVEEVADSAQDTTAAVAAEGEVAEAPAETPAN